MTGATGDSGVDCACATRDVRVTGPCFSFGVIGITLDGNTGAVGGGGGGGGGGGDGSVSKPTCTHVK